MQAEKPTLIYNSTISEMVLVEEANKPPFSDLHDADKVPASELVPTDQCDGAKAYRTASQLDADENAN